MLVEHDNKELRIFAREFLETHSSVIASHFEALRCLRIMIMQNETINIEDPIKQVIKNLIDQNTLNTVKIKSHLDPRILEKFGVTIYSPTKLIIDDSLTVDPIIKVLLSKMLIHFDTSKEEQLILQTRLIDGLKIVMKNQNIAVILTVAAYGELKAIDLYEAMSGDYYAEYSKIQNRYCFNKCVNF